MFGLGTIINTAAIIVGGLLGLVFGRWLTERFRQIVTVAMGLSVCAMSLSGTVSGMLVPVENGFTTKGTTVLIFSLTLGALAGEIINLDQLVDRFGDWLKKKTGSAGEAKFTEGFVTASLTVSVGAMAVLGALMDGLRGDYSILVTKAILDFVIVLILTASMGKGCIFSFLPVLLWQGSLTLLSRLIEPVLSDAALDNLSLVGNVLIFCVGMNLIADGKFRVKVANLLPSIIFAVASAYIPFL